MEWWAVAVFRGLWIVCCTVISVAVGVGQLLFISDSESIQSYKKYVLVEDSDCFQWSWIVCCTVISVNVGQVFSSLNQSYSATSGQWLFSVILDCVLYCRWCERYVYFFFWINPMCDCELRILTVLSDLGLCVVLSSVWMLGRFTSHLNQSYMCWLRTVTVFSDLGLCVVLSSVWTLCLFLLLNQSYTVRVEDIECF